MNISEDEKWDIFNTVIVNAMGNIQKENTLTNRHGGLCFHASFEFVKEIDKRYGEGKACVQAGSLQWPMIEPEHDDGVMDTHMSFMWEPERQLNIKKVLNLQLPEMHVWAALLPDTLVDLTTFDLPRLCKLIIKEDWKAKDPPKFLWTTAEGIPDHVRYTPKVSAISHVLLMWKIWEMSRGWNLPRSIDQCK